MRPENLPQPHLKERAKHSALIKNRQRAKQLIVFDDMRFGNDVRMTDIDGVNGTSVIASVDFNYGQDGFVFYEVKYGNKDMDTGQKAHMVALVDFKTVPALVLQVYHNKDDCDADVYLADCTVSNCYYSKPSKRGTHWSKKLNGLTALEATIFFVGVHCPKYLLEHQKEVFKYLREYYKPEQ